MKRSTPSASAAPISASVVESSRSSAVNGSASSAALLAVGEMDDQRAALDRCACRALRSQLAAPQLAALAHPLRRRAIVGDAHVVVPDRAAAAARARCRVRSCRR